MNAHVHRILVDDQKRAYGVLFERRGRLQRISARKEVILSAGAIGSPQILMLSGIGDAGHLSQVGVPLVFNLTGVGRNLQDHISGRGMVYLINQPASFVEARFVTLPSILKYYLQGGGPMASLSGTEGVAWVKTKYADLEYTIQLL